jgi:hypothetical protein
MTATKVTRAKAMLSKCHDCMGYYKDGKVDCQVTGCPLYPWMPYRQMEPDTGWTGVNPKKVGAKTSEVGSGRPKRKLTEEQRDALRERLSQNRLKRSKKTAVQTGQVPGQGAE